MAGSADSATERSFHATLYVEGAIEDAVAAYDGFATMTVETSDDAWTVRFEAVDEDFDPEVLASEFANYVLAQTIERKRQS